MLFVAMCLLYISGNFVSLFWYYKALIVWTVMFNVDIFVQILTVVRSYIFQSAHVDLVTVSQL